jgi:hypothetical protein
MGKEFFYLLIQVLLIVDFTTVLDSNSSLRLRSDGSNLNLIYIFFLNKNIYIKIWIVWFQLNDHWLRECECESEFIFLDHKHQSRINLASNVVRPNQYSNFFIWCNISEIVTKKYYGKEKLISNTCTKNTS